VRVVWLVRALDDLDAIERFIEPENPRAARAIERKIKDAVAVLGSHPRLGRPGRIAGTTELVVPGTPYIVAYTLAEDRVTVVHGARIWPDAL
jgi:addiction module RelE/StbE family toxin